MATTESSAQATCMEGCTHHVCTPRTGKTHQDTSPYASPSAQKLVSAGCRQAQRHAQQDASIPTLHPAPDHDASLVVKCFPSAIQMIDCVRWIKRDLQFLSVRSSSALQLGLDTPITSRLHQVTTVTRQSLRRLWVVYLVASGSSAVKPHTRLPIAMLLFDCQNSKRSSV